MEKKKTQKNTKNSAVPKQKKTEDEKEEYLYNGKCQTKFQNQRNNRFV